VKENGEYQRFYVEESTFFAGVKFDDHLFDESGHDVLVLLRSRNYHFWLNLTKEELKTVLSAFGSIEIYDKYE
jgi:hypothetical protein